MTPYKPKRGSFEIDRVFRGLGRVRLRTGTHDKRIAERYEVMLEDLPLAVVRLIRDKVLGLRETYDLWSRGETKLLPSAEMLRPLIATMRTWAAEHVDEVSVGEQDRRLSVIAELDALEPDARVQELPRLLSAMRTTHRTRGAKFNRMRTVGMAFARDELGKRSETHAAIAEIQMLPEPPKLKRHHCTVPEALAIRMALRAPWDGIWWAMCCTGMGPKEYFVDGWRPLEHGIEIRGQKQTARERIVPYVVTPPQAVGTPDGFEAALYRAQLGVAPYDARRSYARWLQELRLPAYRQDAYLGHGPKSMTALYSWGDIREWLAEDGRALREYVGEPIQLRVQA